jgi:hypothetical protein
MKHAGRFWLAAAAAIMSPAIGWSGGVDVVRSDYTDRVEHGERVFGDLRFVMGSGQSMEWLELYDGPNLIGAYRDFDVQEVRASPDGKYFLAMSNTPLSALAYAVLDRKGHVVFSMPHNTGLHYCGEPGSKNRYWINTATANARFEMGRSATGSAAREYLKSVTVQGCGGEEVLLGQAAEPLEQPKPRVSLPGTRQFSLDTVNENGERETLFIGNTIANLRGLDPTFAGRTLTLIDGRRPARGAPSCENTLRETTASVLVDTLGNATTLPSHAGTLTGCTVTGSMGNEVLLVYRVMKDGRPFNLARVFDKYGVQLAETELDKAGTLEFRAGGNPTVVNVPGP